MRVPIFTRVDFCCFVIFRTHLIFYLFFATASYNAVNYASNGGAGGRFPNNKVCP